MASFFGLILKQKYNYVQSVSKAFHISSVALDGGEFAKLYLTVANQKYLVATLNNGTPQMTLDLNFSKGDKIKFQTVGNGNLCLLGYLHPGSSNDSDNSGDTDSRDEDYQPFTESEEDDVKSEVSDLNTEEEFMERMASELPSPGMMSNSTSETNDDKNKTEEPAKNLNVNDGYIKAGIKRRRTTH